MSRGGHRGLRVATSVPAPSSPEFASAMSSTQLSADLSQDLALLESLRASVQKNLLLRPLDGGRPLSIAGSDASSPTDSLYFTPTSATFSDVGSDTYDEPEEHRPLVLQPESIARRLAGPRRPLLLDMRPAPAFAEAHVAGSVCLSIPTLLLRRRRAVPTLAALRAHIADARGRALWDDALSGGWWDGDVVLVDGDEDGEAGALLLAALAPLLEDGTADVLAGGFRAARACDAMRPFIVLDGEREELPQESRDSPGPNGLGIAPPSPPSMLLSHPRTPRAAPQTASGPAPPPPTLALPPRTPKSAARANIPPPLASAPPPPLPEDNGQELTVPAPPPGPRSARTPRFRGATLPALDTSTRAPGLPEIERTAATPAVAHPWDAAAAAIALGPAPPPPSGKPSLRRLDTRSAERLPKLSLRTALGPPTANRPMKSATLAAPPLSAGAAGWGPHPRWTTREPSAEPEPMPAAPAPGGRPWANSPSPSPPALQLAHSFHRSPSHSPRLLPPPAPNGRLSPAGWSVGAAKEEDDNGPPPTPSGLGGGFGFGFGRPGSAASSSSSSSSASSDDLAAPWPHEEDEARTPTTTTMGRPPGGLGGGLDSDDQCESEPPPSFVLSTILPNFLFLGPEPTEEAHIEEMRAAGITRILNLALECGPDDQGLRLGERFVYRKIGMRDTVEEDNVAAGVREACGILDDAALHSAPTYVHCKAGKSRSVTAVMGYLIHANAWTLGRAYAFVRARRKGISPNIGFVSALMAFEEAELGGKSVGVVKDGAPTPGGAEDAGSAVSGGGGAQKKAAYARRPAHLRESLPPAFTLSADAFDLDGTDALGAGAETEIRDANGRYRFARRAPVDAHTLQPGRRVSKAGLESGGWEE